MSHLVVDSCSPELLHSRSAGYFDLEIPHRIVAEGYRTVLKMMLDTLFTSNTAGENY